MHDAIFCQSFQPPPVTVLGLRLHNYTIGHEIALIRQGNPLVTYAENSFSELPSDARRLALVMAVDICCQKSRFSKWLLGWRSYRADVAVETAKFRSYLNDGSQDLPTAKMPRMGSAPFHYFGGPDLARILNYLPVHQQLIDAHFGGSPLNVPFGLAKMLYSAHLESEGHIWVKNQQDMWRDEKKRAETPESTVPAKVSIGDQAVKDFQEALAKANQKN